MRRLAAGIALVYVATASAVGAASIDTGPETPMRGKPGRVAIASTDGADSAWSVSIAYFPNSVIEHVDSLGRTDAGGAIEWTPRFAGLATITAIRGDDTTSQAISIRFPGMPGAALIVFLVAGAILLGGAGWSLAKLTRDAEATG